MDITFETEVGVFNHRVAGIYVKNDCVLIHKNVNDSFWALPGGRVGLMESSQEALIREFKEELNADVECENFLWVVENFFEYEDKPFHEVGFYYEVSGLELDFEEGAIFKGSEGDSLLYKWQPIERLDEIELYPFFLKRALKEKKTNKHFIQK